MDEDGNNYDDDAWGYVAEDDDAVYYEYDDAAWEDDGNYMAVYYQENVADSVMDDYGFDPDEYDECFVLMLGEDSTNFAC